MTKSLALAEGCWGAVSPLWRHLTSFWREHPSTLNKQIFNPQLKYMLFNTQNFNVGQKIAKTMVSAIVLDFVLFCLVLDWFK